MKLTSLLVLLATLTLPVMTRANVFEKGDKRVTVSGQCVLETTPDRGSVTFIVETLNADPKIAIQKTTELHEKLRNELKRSKVKDLELSTTEYTVAERKEWENNKNVSKGFFARLGVRATTPEIGNLGDLIAIAARLGVKETTGLSTYLSDQKSLDEKKRCLETAAKNAREKAEALAKSLNTKVGRVLAINERGGGNVSEPPMPMRMESMSMKSMADSNMAPPTISGQKLTISQDVEVSFSLE
ncbi:MAG: SIMPL domain-containing protein [Bdellovibrionales bacterium]|nr:SIMPL domain-containing protein [Bdellovibrionales bacterium]